MPLQVPVSQTKLQLEAPVQVMVSHWPPVQLKSQAAFVQSAVTRVELTLTVQLAPS